MKNKCKHENASWLCGPYNFGAGGIKWMWRKDCGATRMDVITEVSEEFNVDSKYNKGKWVSPKIAREK